MYPPGPEPMITTSNFSICHFVIRDGDEQSSRTRSGGVPPHSKTWPSLRVTLCACVLECGNAPPLFDSKIQRQFFRVFDAVLHFDQKGDGFFPVDCAVIVTERQIHHGANFYFPVHGNWSRHDFVHAEDSALWRIQNRRGEQGSVHSAVCDCECATLQIFNF